MTRSKHHGLLYWLFIGWWWKPFCWLFWTLPVLIIHTFKPKKPKTATINNGNFAQSPKTKTIPIVHVLPEQAEAKRLLEIQQAKNREIAAQKETANKEAAKRLLVNEKPLAVVSVSKIGQSNKFYDYQEPSYAEIGDIVSISHEIQYHQDNDKDREAYVVTFDYLEIGEITESAVDRITDAGSDIGDVLGVISKIDLDEEPTKMSISIYRTDDNGNLSTRQLHTFVTGCKYMNEDGSSRQEYISQLKTGSNLILKTSVYEGKPTVEVYTEADKQIGFLKKELATEFSNKLKKNQIESVSVTKIAEKDGVKYCDIVITIAKI